VSPTGGSSLPSKPELVIGLVGASGTELREATKAVRSALSAYRYEVVPVRLSSLMREVKGGGYLAGIKPEEKRIWSHMDAGDLIRKQSGRDDAVAALAVGYIADYRQEKHGGAPASGTAFVLDSLKHPAEVASMRRIYRDRFTLISVHSPTEERLEALAKRIAKSHGTPQKAADFREDAKRIMTRDEHDDEHKFGQNVREAFTQGDVYVPNKPSGELKAGTERYLRLFFGDPYLTPTRDEYAMFQTHAAALRSADLSRQVGAAICAPEGEIVAVGCNEVPSAFGGQYWPEDDPDGRDFQLGYDSNVKQRDAALEEAFTQLESAKLLANGAQLGAFMAATDGTRLANLTEFGRPVHAEMAALLDAARRGVAVAGQRLFSTTFPCHNCARHIIGAGITEVVYREPYEKSLASDLHRDAVVVDPAKPVKGKVVIRRFVGIGPPRYLELFAMPRRKTKAGERVEWSESEATPRLVRTEGAYLTNEEDFLDETREPLKKVELEQDDKEGKDGGA
jgi:deoxycytidylate deaminase